MARTGVSVVLRCVVTIFLCCAVALSALGSNVVYRVPCDTPDCLDALPVHTWSSLGVPRLSHHIGVFAMAVVMLCVVAALFAYRLLFLSESYVSNQRIEVPICLVCFVVLAMVGGLEFWYSMYAFQELYVRAWFGAALCELLCAGIMVLDAALVFSEGDPEEKFSQIRTIVVHPRRFIHAHRKGKHGPHRPDGTEV